MMEEIKIKDIMSTRVVTARPDETVAVVAKRMKDEDIGSVVICKGEIPIGIATREDVTNKVAAADIKPSKILIKDIMNAPVITCSPDESLEEVTRRMAKYGYERLPVKYLNKLVGFISVREVLRVSPGLLGIMKERLEIEQPPEISEEFNSGDCELCGNFSEQLHNVNDKWVCDSCKDEAAEL